MAIKLILTSYRASWRSLPQSSTHLKGRPVHRHVDPVIVAPPLQVLFVVSIGNSVVKLFVDSR